MPLSRPWSSDHMLMPGAGGRGDTCPHSLTEAWPGLALGLPFPEIIQHLPLIWATAGWTRDEWGNGWASTPSPLGHGTEDQRSAKMTVPSFPEPKPDNQMVIIITVVSVLISLFVTSVLLCFIFGQQWHQRRSGAYRVQAAWRRVLGLRRSYQAQPG